MSSSVSNRRAPRTPSSRSRRARASRWLVAFVAVTVLHWLAAQWIMRHRDIPQPAPPTHVPVQIALLKPQQIERSASPPAAAHAPPAPHPAAPKPHAAPPHTLTAIAHEPHPKVAAQPARPEAAAPAQPASAPAVASAPAAASAPGGAQTAQGNGDGNHPAAPAGPASHGLKFSVPPSGDLSYDTFYNGMRNQPGTIHWSSDGQHYEMIVSVPLPFIGSFNWSSSGHVDAFGLAPDRYSEKRGHRAEDVTTFNRDSKQITFTRTSNALPLPDGAQDRFSMVMQLASLVRGDPDAYKPGVTREFFVADNDSGETWPVTTIGDESVGTDHGFVTARHFMRLPRHDGDRRRIDVWLAPSLGWLPVRLVQTEPNGTQFELVWRGPLTLPSAGAGASGAENAAPGAGAANPAPQSPASIPPAGARDANAPDGTTGSSGTQSAPAPTAPASSPTTTAPATTPAPGTSPATSPAPAPSPNPATSAAPAPSPNAAASPAPAPSPNAPTASPAPAPASAQPPAAQPPEPPPATGNAASPAPESAQPGAPFDTTKP